MSATTAAEETRGQSGKGLELEARAAVMLLLPESVNAFIYRNQGCAHVNIAEAALAGTSVAFSTALAQASLTLCAIPQVGRYYVSVLVAYLRARGTLLTSAHISLSHIFLFKVQEKLGPH